MSLWDDFLEWLYGGQRPVADTAQAPVSDVASGAYLPAVKPGSLIDYGTAHFIDPYSLPVSPLFDLATAPDYSHAGAGNSQPNASTSVLGILFQQFQDSLAQWGDIFGPLPTYDPGTLPTYHSPITGGAEGGSIPVHSGDAPSGGGQGGSSAPPPSSGSYGAIPAGDLGPLVIFSGTG